MVASVLRKVFGSRNDRVLKQYNKVVKKINALEEGIAALSDAELTARTEEFKQRYQDGETLEKLLPEAFAVVREAAGRVLKMRHFDVQLVGGMVLNEGRIAEMRTGEGKTLVATAATYLNALSGKGVHVITVNDYLATRDSDWMGQLYRFLGLSVGVIVGGLPDDMRRAAYAADITYGTNNEFGFDYLRDNMKFTTADKVQRDLNFAIVDEVDSILIDEARTPLIISGPAADSSELYKKINELIPKLSAQAEEDGPGDYALDEKAKQVSLTEEGHQRVEDLLEEAGLLQPGESLYDASNIILMHHLLEGIRAHALFKRDVDYVVQNGQIVIVDEFTGRTMPGRRWSGGTHQAVEAKEGVEIQAENQTLASITFQNYFRLYNKLAGMTGTADTEAFEFQSIYGLEVIVIPTHRPMVRDDRSDLVYMTQREKYNAIVEDILETRAKGRPILVGTASIEASELLSNELTKRNIEHQVLNAKHHEKEAQIIAQAGRPGTVTIATNMAGRGTDIVLGGSLQSELAELGDEVDDAKTAELTAAWQQRHDDILTAGGLHIIGTERHESRRIDNQLRGRAGRQGDAGSSRFYLSLEDSLMRIFASDRVASLMQKLGMEEGEYIEHKWVTKAIENAQRKVEGRNFDIRKNLLEFDDVANDQRKVIYEQRNELMEADDVSETIEAIRADVLDLTLDPYIPPQSLEEQWDVPGAEAALEETFGLKLPLQQWLAEDDTLYEENLRAKVLAEIVSVYKAQEEKLTAPFVRHFEKAIMLQVLDALWKEHLAAMDYLRQGIGLRGFAQKNPKQEYKRESFEMFTSLLEKIKTEVVKVISHQIGVHAEDIIRDIEAQQRQQIEMEMSHPDAAGYAVAPGVMGENSPGKPAAEPAAAGNADGGQPEPFVRDGRKVGRNEPCPCGSGKKFKQCCGKLG